MKGTPEMGGERQAPCSTRARYSAAMLLSSRSRTDVARRLATEGQHAAICFQYPDDERKLAGTGKSVIAASPMAPCWRSGAGAERTFTPPDYRLRFGFGQM